MKIRRHLLAPALLAALAAAPVPASDAPAGGAGSADLNLPGLDPEARLETILVRFDEAQQAIRTLTADFSEHKELALLRDPVEASGRFYYADPQQAKWEYIRPDRRIFLISGNSLTQYFPAEKTAERKDLGNANMSRLFKVFGMGQSSRELEDMYDISLGEEVPPEDPHAGTYQLILTPRRRLLEKRISRVVMWVGDQDFLPRAMRMETPDGDFTAWEFSNVRINSGLAESVFSLDLPPDVEIRKGISLFQSPEGSAP